MTTLISLSTLKRSCSCMNRPFANVLTLQTNKQPINQVLLLFICILGMNNLFPFCLQLYCLQSTTPPPPQPTGTFWYKQTLLPWLIKTTWTCIVRVHARTERQWAAKWAADIPAWSPSFERHRAVHYQGWVHLSLWGFLHMNTNVLVYSVFYFITFFVCGSQMWYMTNTPVA